MKIKNIYHHIIPESTRISFHNARKKTVKEISLLITKVMDRSVFSMQSRLEELKRLYSGERCFIMGNGPSLNKMDLSFFKNEYVWGSNRCYLLFNRIEWRPKFYVAVDKRVVPDNSDELNRLSIELPETLFFYPVEFRLKKILNSAKNVFWFNETNLKEDNLPYSMFSSNSAAFVYSVRTVTVAMLQLAVYMGFNPIYLIGCDTNYVIPQTVKHEPGDASKLVSTEDDPNHFDPSYFGKGKKWHIPHVDRMIFHYEQAKKVCDEMNVKVINATVGGKLEVFPRSNYLDLFK